MTVKASIVTIFYVKSCASLNISERTAFRELPSYTVKKYSKD